jgi:4'-phosphopantetheinyl transferase
MLGSGGQIRGGNWHGEVAVWLAIPAEQATAERVEYLEGLLSGVELARVRNVHSPEVGRQRLVAYGLARLALSDYYPARLPSQWVIRFGDRGRPEVVADPDGSGLRFNLSHTEGVVACAVTRTRDIGIDVEELDPNRQSLALAERLFAPVEVAALRALDEARRDEHFTTLWTLKESYLKARGLGIGGAIALKDCVFDLDLDGTGPVCCSLAAHVDDCAADWQFEVWSPTQRHRAALAVRRAPASRARTRFMSLCGGEGLPVATRIDRGRLLPFRAEGTSADDEPR